MKRYTLTSKERVREVQRVVRRRMQGITRYDDDKELYGKIRRKLPEDVIKLILDANDEVIVQAMLDDEVVYTTLGTYHPRQVKGREGVTYNVNKKEFVEYKSEDRLTIRFKPSGKNRDIKPEGVEEDS